MRQSAEIFEKKLSRDFFDRPADQVAPDLIGKILCVHAGSKNFRVRILETEAYVGQKDLACHASKGLTKRTAVMFGPPGFAYVYLIYGMHYLFNVVTHREGEAHAVLIRAADWVSPVPTSLRLDGPGKLTRALGIHKRHHAMDLCADEIFFLDAPKLSPLRRAPRIGVDYAGSWAKKPLRYFCTPA
jgi:DNA-3-methyladenine glycosylase